MSPLQLLRAQDYPRMPWKNGGGFTEEITRDAGEGLEGFGWRLSIADIEESGGFSTFAGYQRIITVLQGDGMRLLVDGQASRPLLPFDAFAFGGESQVSCKLLGGPIRDFNLIYAPQRYRARLQWFDGTQRAYSSASTVLLFAASGHVEASVPGHGVQQLGLYDCLHLEGNDGLLELDVQGRFCLIELMPR
ncbi:HutD family protein [Pseudomonas guariconensis]|uniref:HutD/Ves family protein n=1 Tax=Pseudomonas TaxID=286 RepID=UPI001CE3D1D7|nr:MULTISPECIES: HutD family protein [Pseudomonas]MCO7643604.1 HutD family protein [Pseudomonas sp. S 311-6]MCO7517955.1 HutD family protein [Pseudomonas putida]MCO7568190.1 HutD family protein [Pseudomonas mosselii]MCO7597485.1 HutD family protein [Pseudomonas guariconensis]MCO7608464.1 HutD family protein [Pseudomonas guariconensis]